MLDSIQFNGSATHGEPGSRQDSRSMRSSMFLWCRGPHASLTRGPPQESQNHSSLSPTAATTDARALSLSLLLLPSAIPVPSFRQTRSVQRRAKRDGHQLDRAGPCTLPWFAFMLPFRIPFQDPFLSPFGRVFSSNLGVLRILRFVVSIRTRRWERPRFCYSLFWSCPLLVNFFDRTSPSTTIMQ